MPVQNVTIYKQFTSSGANAVINRTDTHLKQSVRPYRYLLNTKLHPNYANSIEQNLTEQTAGCQMMPIGLKCHLKRVAYPHFQLLWEPN
ncbi:unnamed protein product [Ceratitis capitata]|uniref:(Mediterranean fruit fly) hypothetical protein n=1 Tax=Ceratitis capitata TaxID=7213 RepID=A0A811UDR5_CERCA|nr:unnamed protein product [Ceratitis capitata]